MQILRDEEVKNNDYIFNQTIANARILFRYRCDMYFAKYNFKNDAKFKSEGYLCDSCESSIDENTHVLTCISYKELREGLRLDSDDDLAWYLQQVLEMRTKLRLTR